MRYIAASFQDVLDSRRRRLAYKIYAWDPGTVTISQVASATSNLSPSIPMPMDLTPYASEISWSDKQLSFTMVDPRNLFHPDTGAYRNYLGDGAILRLVEGDEMLSEDDWVTSFTGQIHGRVGLEKSQKHRGDHGQGVSLREGRNPSLQASQDHHPGVFGGHRSGDCPLRHLRDLYGADQG